VSRGVNKVLLVGEVGRGPEMRYTPDGTPVATFGLGARRSWTAPDGSRHEAVDWFNVVVWRELAETCNAELSEGRRVYVEGRIQTRSWVDAEGLRRYRTEIVAEDVTPLDDAAVESRSRQQVTASSSPASPESRHDPGEDPPATSEIK